MAPSKFQLMRAALGAIILSMLGVCCDSVSPRPRNETDAAMFAPAAMRIHPIFTRVTDWSGDGKLDGVEVLVELQDQFGDPTKASGRVIFELYAYQQYDPDPRGERLAYWTAQLATRADQADRWNRTSRTYSFTLEYDPISPRRTYVLAATFELSGGGRFFDRIILEPKERLVESPATRPATDESR
jgi:hypothetical protein